MTAGPAQPPAALLAEPLDLLERAVSYTRGVLVQIRPEWLCSPTPCAEWDLAALLHHMEDSLAALTEAADLGFVPLQAPAPDPDCVVPVVRRLQLRTCALLGAWAGSRRPEDPVVGGVPIPAAVLGRAGALDVAVHGWDVSASLGPARDLPPALAEDLLPVAHALVTGADRPHRFAAPVPVSAGASPSERLLAFLGRPS